MTTEQQHYLTRCTELALKGAGYVAPNPMVGAVLVCGDEIIGEGWHRLYGEAHAEVNCIGQAIAGGHENKFRQSVLYVSLEPCSHHGKTPPCADLIIKHGIPEVVIGCRDPFAEVNGKGIEKLRQAGVNVILAEGKAMNESLELNRRFLTFHTLRRPYVILKWAQTADGFIGTPVKRLLISNEITNRLVHRWRSEEAGILVGTNTALADNPALTNRLYPGPSPVRLVIDNWLKLPTSLKLFDRSVKTVVFNFAKHEEEDNLLWYKLEQKEEMLPQLISALHHLRIQSVLVEGGRKLLQSFITAGTWDEARVITNVQLFTREGIAAPVLAGGEKQESLYLENDRIDFYRIYKNNV